MVAPATRRVVLVRFPFSDLTSATVRPAVVLADAGRGDWVLCQITSNPYADPAALRLEDADFASGSLRQVSYIRPGKLFTASALLMAGEAGRLKPEKHAQVIAAVVALLEGRVP